MADSEKNIDLNAVQSAISSSRGVEVGSFLRLSGFGI